MNSSDDVTGLALAAGQGDRAALSEFIRRTQSEVWRFVARLAGSGSADDLTQETYLRMLSALPRFEGRSTARVWLLSIARRAVVDKIRHERARPPQLAIDPTTADDLWAVSPDPGSSLRLEEMLNLLDADRREALVLTQLLGYTYAETAEICGCAVGTVRSRVARARAELVTALAGQALQV